MSYIHYKFQSTNEHDTITFDGLSISLTDLKTAILAKSKLAQTDGFTLQITNAQSKEVYKTDSDMIPKNTSVTVTRIPVAKTLKGNEDDENMNEDSHLAFLAKRAEDTVSMAEEANIRNMMTESSNDYDPSNYTVKPKFQPRGIPPSVYTCNKCGVKGHYIQNCPKNQYATPAQNPLAPRSQRPVRMAHGIPNSYLIPADAHTQGAVWSKYGYAVNSRDLQAYEDASKRRSKNTAEQPVQDIEIPDNFICPICDKTMKDAVKTPCCGSHFCDSCIRNFLLEDEDQSCPKCNEVDVSPDQLQPDLLLRNAISLFLDKTKTGVRRVKKQPGAKVDPGGSPALPSVASQETTASSPSHTSPSLKIPTNGTPERSATPTFTDSSQSQATTTMTPDTGVSSQSSTTATIKSDASQTTASQDGSQPTSEKDGSSAPSRVPADAASSLSSEVSTVTASSADSTETSKISEVSSDKSNASAVPTSSVATSSSASTTKAVPTSAVIPGTIAPPGVVPAPSMGYSMAAVAAQPAYPGMHPYPGPYHRPMVPGYPSFPPGMRPGFPAHFPGHAYPPAAYPVVGPTRPVLSKEEFYKVKAEMLEKKMFEKETKKRHVDPIMDEFGHHFTKARPRHSPSRSRSRSKSRSRSRSRGRKGYTSSHKRSYSRSPGRRRSRSPGYYKRSRSPRRASPYRHRSPLPYKDYDRGYTDYHRSRHYDDDYRSPRYYDSRRDERYVEKYFRSEHSGRRSPHDRYRDDRESRYLSPHYTPPERRNRTPSPRSKRDDGYDDYRRRYDDDDRKRYEDDDRKRYEDDDRKRLEDSDRKRHADDSNRKRHEDGSDRKRHEDDSDKKRHADDSDKKRHEDDGNHRSDDERRKHSDNPDEERGKHGEKHSSRKRKDRKEVEESKSNDDDQEKLSKERSSKKESSRSRHSKRSKRVSSQEDESHMENEIKEENTKSKDRKRKHRDSDQSSKGSDDETNSKKNKLTESQSDKKTIKTENLNLDVSKETKNRDPSAHDKKESEEDKLSTKSHKNKHKDVDVKSTSKEDKPAKKSSDKKGKKSKSDKSTKTSSKNKKTSNEVKRSSKTSGQENPSSSVSQRIKSDKLISEAADKDISSQTTTPNTASPGAEPTDDDRSQADDELTTIIERPERSRWEREDSESDSRQQSPSKTQPEASSIISRKVLESAESLLRNKTMQPLSKVESANPGTRKRKIQVMTSETDTQSDNVHDSDESDRPDLRRKIDKLKQRKHSSSDHSSSDAPSDVKKVERSHDKRHRSTDKVETKPISSSAKVKSSSQDKPSRSETRSDGATKKTNDLRQNSEDFEPDYDEEPKVASPEKKKELSYEAADTRSESDYDTSSGDDRKKHKHRRKSKSKHKKHKKHGKSSSHRKDK